MRKVTVQFVVKAILNMDDDADSVHAFVEDTEVTLANTECADVEDAVIVDYEIIDSR